MSWTQTVPLPFSHCDPAGIAYYPKLFELLDVAVEAWTADVIGVARHVMHRDLSRGMPTVTLSARFAAVSFHGDRLDLTLDVTKVGGSSVDFTIDVACAGKERLSVDYRQVLVDQTTRRPVPWPADWRTRLESQL